MDTFPTTSYKSIHRRQLPRLGRRGNISESQRHGVNEGTALDGRPSSMSKDCYRWHECD